MQYFSLYINIMMFLVPSLVFFALVLFPLFKSSANRLSAFSFLFSFPLPLFLAYTEFLLSEQFIFRILLLITPIACFITAIIFGIISLSQIKKSKEGGKALAMSGIVIAIFFLLLYIIFGKLVLVVLFLNS